VKSRSQRLKKNEHLLENVDNKGLTFKSLPSIFLFITFCGLVIDFMHCSKNCISTIFSLIKGERKFNLDSRFKEHEVDDINLVNESSAKAATFALSKEMLGIMSAAWKGILAPSDGKNIYFDLFF
jgi:hypothetical protein